jgi:hypothetical protein
MNDNFLNAKRMIATAMFAINQKKHLEEKNQRTDHLYLINNLPAPNGTGGIPNVTSVIQASLGYPNSNGPNQGITTIISSTPFTNTTSFNILGSILPNYNSNEKLAAFAAYKVSSGDLTESLFTYNMPFVLRFTNYGFLSSISNKTIAFDNFPFIFLSDIKFTDTQKTTGIFNCVFGNLGTGYLLIPSFSFLFVKGSDFIFRQSNIQWRSETIESGITGSLSSPSFDIAIRRDTSYNIFIKSSFSNEIILSYTGNPQDIILGSFDGNWNVLDESGNPLSW